MSLVLLSSFLRCCCQGIVCHRGGVIALSLDLLVSEHANQLTEKKLAIVGKKVLLMAAFLEDYGAARAVRIGCIATVFASVQAGLTAIFRRGSQ